MGAAPAPPLVWPSGVLVSAGDLKIDLLNLATSARLSQPQLEAVVGMLAAYRAPDVRSTLEGLVRANPDGLDMFGTEIWSAHSALSPESQAFYASLPGDDAKRALRTTLAIAAGGMEGVIKQLVANPAVFNRPGRTPPRRASARGRCSASWCSLTARPL